MTNFAIEVELNLQTKTYILAKRPIVVIKKGKDAALKRKHHWVFSGAIGKFIGKPKDGDIVDVCSSEKEFLATGHYKDGTISVRIISFSKIDNFPDFWKEKMSEAYQLRRMIGVAGGEETTAYRLIHGEGDGLPGLVIDFYEGICVFQAHSIGMHKARLFITEALKEVYGEELIAVYDKSKSTLPAEYSEKVINGFLHGRVPDKVVKEHGLNFYIDWQTGQKTGFFLDQRENRRLLQHFVKGKTVLNTFCYSGGFSVYALEAGASLVHSVDASEKAIAWTDKNVSLNTAEGKHESFASDVQKFFKSREEDYDVVILDPPAYAKSKKARHRAVQGYRRLNAAGMRKVKKGGILFTFSCSQVVDLELFKNTVMAAALEVGRDVRILHYLSQPADHPVNLFHPEASYLKGLVLYLG